MKILVTGANGYVGRRVARRLAAGGHAVTGLVREIEGDEGFPQVVADLEDITTLTSRAAEVDAVVQTAFAHTRDFAEAVAVDAAAQRALADGLASRGGRLVVSNGTGGFGDTGDGVADESSSVDLAYPLAARNVAEKATLERTDITAMAVRLPLLVYGHAGSVFLPMLVAAAQRHGTSYVIGEGHNRMSTVHVDDAAELYVRAVEVGTRGVYIASAGDDVSLAEVARAVATCTGTPVRSISARQAAEVWNPVWAFLLGLTNRVRGTRSAAELGWRPSGRPALHDDVARGSYRALARTPPQARQI